MEINIRNWTRRDLTEIQRAWLAHCRYVARSDMRLSPDADSHMKEWLIARFRQTDGFGLIAEDAEHVVGFVVGRVNEWESIPPIIEPRRIGMIDALYVAEQFRRQGIGSRLITTALQKMKALNAVAVETIHDARNDGPAGVWHRAGFVPWMVHAYRML